MSKHTRAFVTLFNETARYHHRYTVFRDFVTMAAVSIHNAVRKSDSLEEEYLATVRRYQKDDVDRMAKLLGELVMGLDERPCDFLGEVFMALELGSDRIGQHFTPYEVARVMAMALTEDVIQTLSNRPFVKAQDPAAGAGGLIVALAQTMYEKGINPQKRLWVSCIDVDPVAAMMSYIQLSLLHLPGEVITGNTLSLKWTRVMRTPAHYLGGWGAKLAAHELPLTKCVGEVIPTSTKQRWDESNLQQLSLLEISF